MCPAVPTVAHQLLLGSPSVQLCRKTVCRGKVFIESREKGGIELWADPSAGSLFASWHQGLVGEAEARSSWWLCWQGWKEGAKGDIGEAANLGQTHTGQR